MEKIYNYTKFTNVSRVKYAIYPLYFTGNIADFTAVHRKPRKRFRPVVEHEKVAGERVSFKKKIDWHEF